MRTHFLYDNGNGLSIETDDDPSPEPENPETDDVTSNVQEEKNGGKGGNNEVDKAKVINGTQLPQSNSKQENSRFCAIA